MCNFDDNIFVQLEGQRGVGAGNTSFEFYPHPIEKTVLEIGFGQGTLIRDLINLKNNVYGIDVGKASHVGAIEDKFNDKASLLWLDACMNRFPFVEDYFDVVYCLECIEHLENPAHIFQEVRRTLKKDGTFILAFPRPEDNLGYQSGQHAHMYPGFLLKHSFRMFCDQMYFEVRKYRENGSSAWYQLINKKSDTDIGIHDQIQGNYSKETAYGHLHSDSSWNESNDPEYMYKTFQSENLIRNVVIKEKPD
jgi:2-polyprenyl-3-methyl-5-hydroxy-6-metoxy-1,4-benzoquinol methylase